MWKRILIQKFIKKCGGYNFLIFLRKIISLFDSWIFFFYIFYGNSSILWIEKSEQPLELICILCFHWPFPYMFAAKLNWPFIINVLWFSPSKCQINQKYDHVVFKQTITTQFSSCGWSSYFYKFWIVLSCALKILNFSFIFFNVNEALVGPCSHLQLYLSFRFSLLLVPSEFMGLLRQFFSLEKKHENVFVSFVGRYNNDALT